MTNDKLRKKLSIAVTAIVVLAAATPALASKGLQDEVNQATTIIERFKNMPENGIPEKVLRDAKGLAILTVLKAGFMFSGQGGVGVVVARTGKGWSGPSGIATGGAGFGFQVGAEVTEFVLVLNTPEAVAAFAHGGNVTIGGALSAAAGPVGRTAAAGVMPVAAIYTYSRSQGLFAGVSLEGQVLAARDKANQAYYGRAVTPQQILSGRVKPPKDALKLTRALQRY
jgi:lipid-binding SYLF domain-containing protein